MAEITGYTRLFIQFIYIHYYTSSTLNSGTTDNDCTLDVHYVLIKNLNEIYNEKKRTLIWKHGGVQQQQKKNTILHTANRSSQRDKRMTTAQCVTVVWVVKYMHNSIHI